MFERTGAILLGLTLAFAACGGAPTANIANVPADTANAAANANVPPATADNSASSESPSNKITESDIAKLKWLEGTWRGMDGEKPFYERIYFEGTTMIVESFSDGLLEKKVDTARFELKDGEFGNTVGENRSAASSITETSVQFVPDSVTRPDGTETPVKGHTFRFEKLDGRNWQAILDAPAVKDKPARQVTYKMEPWKPELK